MTKEMHLLKNMGCTSTKLTPRDIKQIKKELGETYTDEEILECYEIYTTNLQKGEKYLSKSSIISVYDKLFAGDASYFAEQIFRVFDRNQNNEVDFTEFMIGLHMSGSSRMDLKLQWAFRMYDLSEDGYITRDEMIFMIQAVCKMTQRRLPDKYGSPRRLTDCIFRELDRNSDNRISWKEFKGGAHKFKIIVGILEPNPDPD